MLPKDRVAAAFEHREYDKVPIYLGSISSRVASHVLGREAYVGGGIQRWRESLAMLNGPEAHREFIERSIEDALDLAEALDLDYVRAAYWRQGQKPTKKIDDYTILYGDEEKSWSVFRFYPESELFCEIERYPKKELTFEDMERSLKKQEEGIDEWQPKASSFEEIRAALERFGDERAVYGGGIGISIPRDPEWLEAIILRPDLVERHLDLQVKRAEKNIKYQAEMGLKYLHGGGDFAGKNGPFYSPQAFHELMLPRLRRVSEICARYGTYHMFASDGDLWPVADDLFGRSGVEGFYEVEAKIMTPRRLRERFPHLTILGGINSQTLHMGSKEEVIRETLDALEVAKSMGSFIVGPSNMVVSETPLENFDAMMETLHKYR